MQYSWEVPKRGLKPAHSGLKSFLDRLVDEYHRPVYLSSDPLEFVHRYEDPLDQEAVAVLAALLAYGNVKQIRRSVEDALERIESAAGTPGAFVLATANPGSAQALEGFVHRFHVGADVYEIFRLMRLSRERHGSVGAHFISHLEPGAGDFGEALSAFIADWKAWARPEKSGPHFGHLLTAPKDGSCCKRWCMLLRWMGRNDGEGGLDPGLWGERGKLSRGFPRGRFLRSSQLVLPLDTHTGRICGYLSLTKRKVLGWKAAVEITAALRDCSAEDPTRYDFALSRLGILDLCQRRYRAEICGRCQLVKVCRFATRGARRGAKNVERRAC